MQWMRIISLQRWTNEWMSEQVIANKSISTKTAKLISEKSWATEKKSNNTNNKPPDLDINLINWRFFFLCVSSVYFYFQIGLNFDLFGFIDLYIGWYKIEFENRRYVLILFPMWSNSINTSTHTHTYARSSDIQITRNVMSIFGRDDLQDFLASWLLIKII